MCGASGLEAHRPQLCAGPVLCSPAPALHRQRCATSVSGGAPRRCSWAPGWGYGGSQGTGPFRAPGSSWGPGVGTVCSSGPAFPPQACTWLARKTGVDFCLVGSRESPALGRKGSRAARQPEGALSAAKHELNPGQHSQSRKDLGRVRGLGLRTGGTIPHRDPAPTPGGEYLTHDQGPLGLTYPLPSMCREAPWP